MNLDGERRLLQLIIALAALVPLTAATVSIFKGPDWLGYPGGVAVDLDSQFRYLSGIFLAIGIGFLSCIPRIQAEGPRFRLLGTIIIAGGLARLWSLIEVGAPSTGHLVGLVLELVLMPTLMIWQAALASRWRRLRMPMF
ncbi:hypothetical protein GCM10023219_14830 [Stakelama sediminis]|uniref:DUF4345 domain-containing protein n=1 Tax=Stakelama sediminis TaxID=463200 RepID=A0A840YWV8_9SPHN|nr:DUF4345 domain-containing protein [Stakelama sediminis]MBB5718211.1 hypothetical protein [Stakelama sediminis]